MAIRASLKHYETESTPKVPQNLTSEMIRVAIERAERRIAPLWSLRNFVAVNPYMGLSEQDFETASHTLARRSGARMTAPRQFYAQAIQTGRITDADLQHAIEQSEQGSSLNSVQALKTFALEDTPATFSKLPTMISIAEEVTGHDWHSVMLESISSWAGTYFDEGQSYWHNPYQDLSPYQAWRAEALIDRTPEIQGIPSFRHTVSTLPESATEAFEVMLDKLAVPASGLDAYLHRLLLTIHGWASYARWQLWEAELHQAGDNTLSELLAIRLAWEVAILQAFEDQGIVDIWNVRKKDLTDQQLDPSQKRSLTGDLLLQSAFENAYQRQLIDKLQTSKPVSQTERPQAQVAFCIDVRSEVFRRALESVADRVDTIGFAGFFGFAIEYVRLGDTQGGAQCPALITPQFVITEAVKGASKTDLAQITEKRSIQQRITKAWRMFKFGAVSCFGFVGPVGLAYLKNLILDTLGYSRPVPHPVKFGLDQDTYSKLTPTIEVGMLGDRAVGMTPQQRLDVAEGVLKAMSLTDNFARIVLLAGHGSTTVNNPYATGLDCGACGGHAGEANARVAVQVLNDPEVRQGLAQRGIIVPEDTVFVSAQHDTTTDEIALFDLDSIPASHADDIAQLQKALKSAGQLARAERASLLNIRAGADVDKAVIQRSKDWSQVRPEWGLAGCSSFIVAPRQHTRGIDLDGRSFLHSYDWQQDEDFSVLELIMTAPMVVASWINLQYYASSVDNEFFGSGNKVLHNVVGTLGVLEGNGGDLRVGLPWQSVHDGEQYVHEPLRLTVMIGAPVEAMNAIIDKHQAVRELVDNNWLHLFALDDTGSVAYQYTGDLNWSPC